MLVSLLLSRMPSGAKHLCTFTSLHSFLTTGSLTVQPRIYFSTRGRSRYLGWCPLRLITCLILALTPALALFLSSFYWPPNVSLNLARNVSIMICKFFFGIVLLLILSHVRNALIEYHIFPETNIDLVHVSGSKNDVRII